MNNDIQIKLKVVASDVISEQIEIDSAEVVDQINVHNNSDKAHDVLFKQKLDKPSSTPKEGDVLTYVDGQVVWRIPSGSAESINYDNLKNLPTLGGITVKGALDDTLNLFIEDNFMKRFSAVAISGDYNDLTNKPEIPSITGLASSDYVDTVASGKVDKVDGQSLVSDAEIARLKEVKNYDDTSVKQQISDLQNNKADKSELFSKNYNDLTNKPEIPSKTSQLENDSEFVDKEYVKDAISEIDIKYTAGEGIYISPDNVISVTVTSGEGIEYVGGEGIVIDSNILSVDFNKVAVKQHFHGMEDVNGLILTLNNKADKSELFSKDYNDLINKPEIPTVNYPVLSVNGQTGEVELDISDLSDNNDKFANKADKIHKHDIVDVNDLQQTLNGFANKSDTYTKEEVDNKVTAVYRPKGSVADFESLPTSGNTVGDIYTALDTGAEFVYTVDNTWEYIGANIDLTPYAKKAEVDSELAKKADKSELFSKDYNDLINKPEIPSKTSQLENDSEFATKSEIPTKTSQLENDSKFVDEEYVKKALEDSADSNAIKVDGAGTTDVNGTYTLVDASATGYDRVWELKGTDYQIKKYNSQPWCIYVIRPDDEGIMYYSEIFSGEPWDDSVWYDTVGSSPAPTVKRATVESITYTAGDNITITADGVISAVDTKYTAGTGISISDEIVSVDFSKVAAKDHEHTTADITDLHEVAKSGSYNDLTDKPTIPSTAGLASKQYVDSLIGDINSILDEINGEEI